MTLGESYVNLNVPPKPDFVVGSDGVASRVPLTCDHRRVLEDE